MLDSNYSTHYYSFNRSLRAVQRSVKLQLSNNMFCKFPSMVNTITHQLGAIKLIEVTSHNPQRDKQTNRYPSFVCIDGWMDIWMDGAMEGGMYEWMNGGRNFFIFVQQKIVNLSNCRQDMKAHNNYI